jgi:hypothetical protein
LEKYQLLQIKFCLHYFEIISTIITLIESKAKTKQAFIMGNDRTNLWAVLVLLAYGVVTAA